MSAGWFNLAKNGDEWSSFILKAMVLVVSRNGEEFIYE